MGAVETSPVGRIERMERYLPFGVSALVVAALGAGAVAGLLGAAHGGHLAWATGGAFGAAYATWELGRSLAQRRLGVDGIAVLALVGALVLGEDLAGAVIALMVATGRALDAWAAGRARRDLHALVARAPRKARRYRAGTLEAVDVNAVLPGDVVMVAPGEVVPVDGALVGPGVLDESALTGEAVPVERAAGDRVRSGVVNAGGPLDVQAVTTAADSTYAGIVRLVAAAESARAPVTRLADRFALWFLLVAVAGAGAAWAAGGATRSVAVLVVATPCPLILAVPVALVSGLSRAARRGIVVKGGAVLERLAACTTVLLDKTGTLTAGRPVLSAVVPAGTVAPEEILRLAGSLDQVSPHVLAAAVVHAAIAADSRLTLPSEAEEVPGKGIRGTVAGRQVALGKAAWVGVAGVPQWTKGARRRARLDGSLTVFVAVDGVPAGVLLFDDPLRPDAARAVRALRQGGIHRVVMVTGDRQDVADAVGAVIGVDEVLAERSPAEKLDVVEAEKRRGAVVMVGDGINDAPALALADVGVAMGTRGATASSESAGVVLTVDRIDRVGYAVRLAGRTLRVAAQSAVGGIVLSFVAMGAAAAGFLPAVWGAILQEGIDVAVIVNALRVLRPVHEDRVLDVEGAALADRFRREHVQLRAALDRLRATADALGGLDPAAALARVREVHAVLVADVAPHEEAEEELLYPVVGRLIGGSDPTGTMSRGHAEIAHQIRRLGQLLDDVASVGPDQGDVAEMRALLYGLYAVLRLHTDQEEESYLTLGDEMAPG